MYKKQGGTFGIREQQYKTKLISLIQFRAKFDINIKDYLLAANVAEIGAFDDICFKANVKVNGGCKPVAVFIKVKHEERDAVLTINNKKELAKWFSSYLTIRSMFSPNKKDELFRGNFDETDCLFVIYTNAKDDLNSTPYSTDFAPTLNSLISTGDDGLRPCFKDELVVFLSEINMRQQLTALGKRMAKLLSFKDYFKMCLMDDVMLNYHVILVQNVIFVSDIQLEEVEKYRIATFREDFFDNNNEFIKLFRETLYIEMLKNRKLDKVRKINLLKQLFSNPSDITILGGLIGNVVTYNSKNGSLEFVNKSMYEYEDFIWQLNKVNVLQSTVYEAIELAAKGLLKARQFKVPAVFGNKDLTIRGNRAMQIERRLTYLEERIHELLIESNPDKVVTLDESLGDGLLSLNGGIAGMVGNILVDDKTTNLMKFTDNWESLGDVSKMLFIKLKSNISNLHEYKFDVKVQKFPKLSFTISEYDKYMAKDFLQKLIFYSNQADENGVETILKKEIEGYECLNIKNIRSATDRIFVEYHHQIRRWWRSQPDQWYLTKRSQLYEKVLSLALDEPLLTILSEMYLRKVMNDTDFRVLEQNNEPVASTIIFVTDTSTFVVARIVHSVNFHGVFDLEYILDLPAKEYATVCNELTEKDKDKTLIFVCNIIHSHLYKRLEKIAEILDDKRIVIVTNERLVKVITTYFKTRAYNKKRVDIVHI